MHNNIAKNKRQPYCVSEPAGHQVVPEYAVKVKFDFYLIFRPLPSLGELVVLLQGSPGLGVVVPTGLAQ